VTTGGNANGAGIAGAASRRYQSLVLLLALLTGAGLFVAAGMRGADSWALFVVASVAALAASARLSSPGDDSPSVATSSAPPPSAELDQAASPSSDAPPSRGPDEVDYLRALRHEFRTPLNAVLGFSDVLLSGIDGDVNASQREDLEIIRASGIRLRILLDSALDISQLAEGELRLDIDRVDLRELVRRAASEAGQLWSNKRHADCVLPERAFHADADEGRLRRSILVLADFLATSHRDADISIALRPSDDHLAIELTAEPAERQSLEALPTTAEVLAAEDATKIRQWPVAVTSELIARHGGSLYHGSAPVRFRIRLPVGEGT